MVDIILSEIGDVINLNSELKIKLIGEVECSFHQMTIINERSECEIVEISEESQEIKLDGNTTIDKLILSFVRPISVGDEIKIKNLEINNSIIDFILPKISGNLTLNSTIDFSAIECISKISQKLTGVNLVLGGGEFVYDTLIKNEFNQTSENISVAVKSINDLSEYFPRWLQQFHIALCKSFF